MPSDVDVAISVLFGLWSFRSRKILLRQFSEYEDIAQDVAMLRKSQDSYRMERHRSLQRLHSGISMASLASAEGNIPTTYIEEGVVWNSISDKVDGLLDDQEDIHGSDHEHVHRGSTSSLDDISNRDGASLIEAIDTMDTGDVMMDTKVITDDLDLRIDDLHYSE